MAELQREIITAGYILTVNRAMEGADMMVALINATTEANTIIGGGARSLTMLPLKSGTRIVGHQYHNLGDSFLMSENAVDAITEYCQLTSPASTRTIHIGGKTEARLNEEEIQFHKLEAQITWRPVCLATACDINILSELDNKLTYMPPPLAEREKLHPLYPVIKDAVRKLQTFHVDSGSTTDATPVLFSGYLAARRDSTGHKSYIQNQKHDRLYLRKRNWAGEYPNTSCEVENAPPYFEVPDLKRAFHFFDAPQALSAIAHFKTAAPGDNFFVGRARYSVSKEPISPTQMKDLAFSEAAARINPAARDAITRWYQNKPTL